MHYQEYLRTGPSGLSPVVHIPFFTLRSGPESVSKPRPSLLTAVPLLITDLSAASGKIIVGLFFPRAPLVPPRDLCIIRAVT